jgi:hypothetical protein
MGLLDDAIREHLELKRKRGADAQEVERQEQEALGPPLRGEFAPAPEDPADPAGAALPPEPVEAADVVPELPPEAAEPAVATEPAPVAEPEPEPVPEPEPEPEPRGDLEGWLDEPAEPAEAQATTEYTPPDVEQPPEEPPAAEAQAGEDVLEETPEFLQETPEHERLWFEQKPPRDFDLDR